MAARTRKLADGRVLHAFRCRQADGHGKGSCQAWASLSGVEAVKLAERLRRDLQAKAKLRARAIKASNGSLAAAGTARARATLAEYAADYGLHERIGWEAYKAGLDARAAAVEEAEATEEREQDEEEAEAALPDPKHFGDDWDRVPMETRRSRLQSGIDTVFVRRRSSRDEALAERIHIRWRGMPPVDLPRKGRRDYTPRPFLFDRPDDVGAVSPELGEPGGRD
jgi:hypothetical protein